MYQHRIHQHTTHWQLVSIGCNTVVNFSILCIMLITLASPTLSHGKQSHDADDFNGLYRFKCLGMHARISVAPKMYFKGVSNDLLQTLPETLSLSLQLQCLSIPDQLSMLAELYQQCITTVENLQSSIPMINRICDDFNRTIRGELQKIHGDLRHAYGRVTVPGYRTLLNEWFGIYPVALELNASGAQPMYYNTFIDNNDGPGNGEIWPHTTVAKTFFNLLTLPPTIGMLHLDFRNQILRNENLEWVILSHMQFSFPYSILYKLFFPDEPLPFWVEAGWELRLHKEQ